MERLTSRQKREKVWPRQGLASHTEITYRIGIPYSHHDGAVECSHTKKNLAHGDDPLR